jgi:glycosyltransferase involved in cell wall biosynthesis
MNSNVSAVSAEIHKMALIHLPKTKGRRGQYGHLKECLRRFKPDVVSSHGYVSQFYYWLYSRFHRDVPPCVAFMHGLPSVHDFRSWVYWKLWFMGLGSARYVVCVSKDTRDKLEKMGIRGNKLVVVPNCTPREVSLEKTPRRREHGGPLVLGFLSRLSFGKRLDVLLVAMAELTKAGVNCRLLVGGTGELEMQFKGLAHRLGIESKIDFVGYVDHPLQFLSKVDVFVLLSDFEGMPVSLLEAASAGVPVIANRVGGVPEVIEHKVNGLLVDELENPPLCDAIALLAGDEALRYELGRNQLDIARSKFSPKTRADAVMEVYQRACRAT